MKKFGIVIIALFAVLLAGLFIDEISEYSAIGLVMYVPLILILSSTNLLKGENRFKGRKILVVLSTLSLILILSTELLGRIYVDFWDYSEQVYYVSIFLFISSCIVVLANNLKDIASSSVVATDIIILLIPLAAFFYTNFVISSDFVHIKYITQIDVLSNEINRNNKIASEELGNEFDIYFPYLA